MGLLKHVVLPIFALVHTWVAVTAIFGNRGSLPAAFDWPDADRVGGLSLYENHAFGILGGFHGAFAFGAVNGIFQEHGHYRAVFAIMEMIVWINGAVDAASLGFPCVVAYIFAGLAAVGLVVHMKEPGIFTKDKNANSINKNQKQS